MADTGPTMVPSYDLWEPVSPEEAPISQRGVPKRSRRFRELPLQGIETCQRVVPCPETLLSLSNIPALTPSTTWGFKSSASDSLLENL